jgi:hypothetical protein
VPRLSIIIPVVDDSQGLDDTLVSVLENRPANCEVLVVHNQPYHDPYNLSDEVRFVEAEHGATATACWNRGLSESQSPVIHLLACGLEVCAGWADAALRHFHDDPAVAAVAALIVERADREKIVSAGLGYRAEGTLWSIAQGGRSSEPAIRPHELCSPDWPAGFYRAAAVRSVGGFWPFLGAATAAVDLGLALRRAGFRCVLDPECLTHVAPETLRRESAFRRGRDTERLFWRWLPSRSRMSSLVGHAALWAGEGVVGIVKPSLFAQMAGRACGVCETALIRRRTEFFTPKAGERSSIVPSPHFAVGPAQDRRPTSRVA